MNALHRLILANPVLQREMRARWRRGRLWIAPVAVFALLVVLALLLLLPGVLDGRGWFKQEYPPILSLLSYSLANLVAFVLSPALAALFLMQERTQQTLDGLLVTPLSCGQVLFGKLATAATIVAAATVPCLAVSSLAAMTALALQAPDWVMWENFYPAAFMQWIEVPLVALLGLGLGAAAGVGARRAREALGWACGLMLPAYGLVKHAPWLVYALAGARGDAPWPIDELHVLILRALVTWLFYGLIGVLGLTWAHRRLRREANRA